MTKTTLVCVFGLSLVSFSQAQTLTGRSSTQNYSYVYGAGGDSHHDTISETRTDLVASDGMNSSFFGATSGTLPGDVPYWAEAGIDMDQAYSIFGAIPNFNEIYVESSSSAHAANFTATSQMLSGTPGNGLILNFDVATLLPYHFSGFISSSPSEVGAGNFVALQRFDGIVWQQVHNSLFLPGQQGTFDYTGDLTPGMYRLNSANNVTAFGNEDTSSVYAYSFQAVPEPMTMLALAPGLVYLARKRKKS